jgi:hypothetical protein
MKKLLLLILIITSGSALIQAQINAITESGEEVYLFDDGTWKYVHQTEEAASIIPRNKLPFYKEKDQIFQVKSTKTNFGIWINPKKWTFKKQSVNADVEYEFQLRGEDLYGMFITEKLEIPLSSLKKIAYENATLAAPDAIVTEEEYRTVNDLDVLMMKMEGTIDGIRFIYHGYYYSNESGTMQLVMYTGKNLMEDYVQEAIAFLNGLSEFER